LEESLGRIVGRICEVGRINPLFRPVFPDSPKSEACVPKVGRIGWKKPGPLVYLNSRKKPYSRDIPLSMSR